MSRKRQSDLRKYEIYFYGLKTDEAKEEIAKLTYDIISPFLRKRKAAGTKSKKGTIPADSGIKGA